MPAGALDNQRAGWLKVMVRHDCLRVGALDIRQLQRLFRKIKPPDGSVFVYVTQDVCELKGAAKMMGKRLPVRIVHAEDTHAQSPDGRSNPVAIKVEFFQGRSLDVRARVHFDAVNNRQEIVLMQAETGNRPGQAFE